MCAYPWGQGPELQIIHRQVPMLDREGTNFKNRLRLAVQDCVHRDKNMGGQMGVCSQRDLGWASSRPEWLVWVSCV